MTKAPSSLLISLSLLPLMAGCQAPGAHASHAPTSKADRSSAASALEYLLSAYDRNQDQGVSPGEFGRSSADFDRLDVNGDGVVSADDFRARGRRMLGLAPARARSERARHLLAWYFQGDGNPHRVTEEEVVQAWSDYDSNNDGWVGRREFDAASLEHASAGRRPAGALAGLIENETTDPWERILEGVDRDDNGLLEEHEISLFYRSSGDENAWRLDPQTGVPVELDLEGLIAPDFTLSTLRGSGELVTLSEFAGERPVALIFGSYT